MTRLGLCRAASAVSAAALVLLPALSSAHDHSDTSCPIPCHHGRCVEVQIGTTYKCDCDPVDTYTMLGFSGPSCDIPYRQCPDYERRCYNNAECVTSASNPGKFVCDCTKAYDVSAFAGHECQYSATEVCEAFAPVSEDAFCVNGGKCRSTVLRGEDHPGCDCPDEFEGSKCQYLKGTAPAEESGGRSRTRPRGEGTTDLHPGVIGGIVCVALLVVGAFGYMIWSKRRHDREGIERQGEVDKETLESDGFANDEQARVSPHDLELHPDGSSTMKDVVDEKAKEGADADADADEGDGVKVDIDPDVEML